MKSKFGNIGFSKQSGYYIVTSSKENNHKKFLHRLIWEDFYGCDVPDGYVIHHKDGSKLNNCILNLGLMKRNEHSSLHMSNRTLSDSTKRKLSEGKKRDKNPSWVDYARIIKTGFNIDGNQNWSIKFKSKILKTSIDIGWLVDWFCANYPLEIIKVRRDIVYCGEER